MYVARFDGCQNLKCARRFKARRDHDISRCHPRPSLCETEEGYIIARTHQHVLCFDERALGEPTKLKWLNQVPHEVSAQSAHVIRILKYSLLRGTLLVSAVDTCLVVLFLSWGPFVSELGR